MTVLKGGPGAPEVQDGLLSDTDFLINETSYEFRDKQEDIAKRAQEAKWKYDSLNDSAWIDSPENAAMMNEIRDALEGECFDSIKYLNDQEGVGELSPQESLILLRGDQARSRNAKLDPAKTASKNILASHPAATVLGGSLAAALLAQMAVNDGR